MVKDNEPERRDKKLERRVKDKRGELESQEKTLQSLELEIEQLKSRLEGKDSADVKAIKAGQEALDMISRAYEEDNDLKATFDAHVQGMITEFNTLHDVLATKWEKEFQKIHEYNEEATEDGGEGDAKAKIKLPKGFHPRA